MRGESRWARIRGALDAGKRAHLGGNGRGRPRPPRRSASSSCFAVVVAETTASAPPAPFTVGVGITAYTLGLRHAFDADHIGAIDNTTRKLMTDGQRPLSVGFFFSLGHSTIVFVLAFLFAIGVRALSGAGRATTAPAAPRHRLDRHRPSRAPSSTSSAILNLLILVGISRSSGDMRERPLRRGRARGPARTTRLHEPLLRPRHRGGHEAVADVPGRRSSSGSGSTPPPRSRCWSSPAGAAGARAAVLRDPLPADPVRRRDVAARHDRRRRS